MGTDHCWRILRRTPRGNWTKKIKTSIALENGSPVLSVFFYLKKHLRDVLHFVNCTFAFHQKNMKLRIAENELRFRLNKTDVACLSSGEDIFLSIPIALASIVSYRLSPIKTDETKVTLESGSVVISLPEKQTKTWALSNEISWSIQYENGSSSPLLLLIEKDFDFMK